MIVLLQRVTQAHVEVDSETIAAIGAGVLALVAVEQGDTEQQAKRLLQRILGYRLFPDESQRMNLSLSDTGGGLLLVPQFTLAADTRKGMRPSFTPAAEPQQGEHLFGYLQDMARQMHADVACGRFGSDMKVHLVNDGPVTFWLQVAA